MKIIYIVIILMLGVSQGSNAQSKSLRLINTINLVRTDELIVLKHSDIEKIFGVKEYTGRFSIRDSKGFIQNIQFDDLDKDGKWDEAVFLYSFKANQTASFNVKLSEDSDDKPKIRAYLRHKRKKSDNSFGANLKIDSIPAGQLNTDFSKVKLPPFLTEGPAWENDKVGFRLYFDIRNGKDIWGKTTTAMMMDSVGVNPDNIYHKKESWGMDIYKVGSSLSAGALAINVRTPESKDSLIRLGGKNMGKVIYEQIATGPNRVKFKLTYPEWKYLPNAEPILLTEEISIWGGQYFYESKVLMKHAPAKAQLVTGFADLYQIPADSIKSGKSSVYYSYGNQSENHDSLGLALLSTNDQLSRFDKSLKNEVDIRDSYLLHMKPLAVGKANSFRFYAAWEQSDHNFRDSINFKKYLTDEVKRFENKIVLKWR